MLQPILIARACRSGVCRLSVAYSPEISRRVAQQLRGRDSVKVRAGSWSFTVVKPGKVEGHIFLVQN